MCLAVPRRACWRHPNGGQRLSAPFSACRACLAALVCVPHSTTPPRYSYKHHPTLPHSPITPNGGPQRVRPSRLDVGARPRATRASGDALGGLDQALSGLAGRWFTAGVQHISRTARGAARGHGGGGSGAACAVVVWQGLSWVFERALRTPAHMSHYLQEVTLLRKSPANVRE